VRLIAATNRDLRAEVDAGRFRQDLFYRLNVFPIHVPPLRERRADIPALVDSFIARFNEKHGKAIAGISREAMDALSRYGFPGNVRELENLVERAVVLSRSETLLRRDFPELEVQAEGGQPGATGSEKGSEGGFEERVRAFEAGLIERALEKAEGNQSKAAQSLGITERHLRSRMEKLGLRNRWK